MIAFSYIGTPFPFTSIKQIFGNCSDGNYSNSYIPGLNEKIDQIAITADPSSARGSPTRSTCCCGTTSTLLPLYQRPDLAAVNANLANCGAFGFETPGLWEDIGYMS